MKTYIHERFPIDRTVCLLAAAGVLLALSLAPGESAAAGKLKTKPKPKPAKTMEEDSGSPLATEVQTDSAMDESEGAVRTIRQNAPAPASLSSGVQQQVAPIKPSSKLMRLELLTFGPSAELLAKGKSMRRGGIFLLVLGSLSIVAGLTAGLGTIMIAQDMDLFEDEYTGYGEYDDMNDSEYDAMVDRKQATGIGLLAGGLGLGAVMLAAGIPMIKRMNSYFIEAVKAWKSGNPGAVLGSGSTLSVSPMLAKGTAGFQITATF